MTTGEIQSTSMRMRRVWAVIVVLTTMSLLAQAQSQPTTTTGTVTSVTRATIVVRINETEYALFTMNNNTTRPAMIAVGSIVEVTSTPTPDAGVRYAQTVRVTRLASGAAPAAGGAAPAGAAAGAAAGGAAAAGGGTQEQPDNVPASVRNAQRSLEREAKYWHFGFHGGFALDPETAVIGMHVKFAPIFTEQLAFRPTFEYAFGEISKDFSINAHLLYNVPLALGRRDVYFGGGPSFNWVEQSLGKGVNWSDFHYDAALDILAGIQFHSGMFTEIRTSVWASPSPVFHMIIGYTF